MPENAERAREGLSYQLRTERSEGKATAAPGHIACLTLLLTYRCPAACDHCIFSCDRTHPATLDVTLGRRVIEAAARRRPLPALSFSGGEPFIVLATLRELMRTGHALGMASEVVTSAVWVRDPAHARVRLAELADLGLATVCVSYDRFHAPFVDAWRVRATVLAALDLGLRAVINTAIDPQAPAEAQTLGGTQAYLSRALDLPASTLEQCYINRLCVVPAGRARARPSDAGYPAAAAALAHGGCAFATSIVTLSPQGLLYPCCGAVVAEDVAHAALFVHDDLAGRSVDEIADTLEALGRDLFFQLLHKVGPVALLAGLARRRPDVRLRPRYTSECDACLELTRNAAAAAATQTWLTELGDSCSMLPSSDPVALRTQARSEEPAPGLPRGSAL